MIKRIMSLFRRPTIERKVQKDSQLNVYNIAAMLSQEPESFDYIRFDSINNCNVKCVYCHNHRTDAQVATDDLKSFLNNNVLGVRNFQMGCIK